MENRPYKEIARKLINALSKDAIYRRQFIYNCREKDDIFCDYMPILEEYCTSLEWHRYSHASDILLNNMDKSEKFTYLLWEQWEKLTKKNAPPIVVEPIEEVKEPIVFKQEIKQPAMKDIVQQEEIPSKKDKRQILNDFFENLDMSKRLRFITMLRTDADAYDIKYIKSSFEEISLHLDDNKIIRANSKFSDLLFSDSTLKYIWTIYQKFNN
jgi:hypothetical protein